MKWVKAILGVAVLAAFAYGVQVYRGTLDAPNLPGIEAVLPPAEVAEGTEITLLLLSPLTSGGSKVGEEVKLVVAEDIRAPDGRVVVAQGALAVGKVAQSRAANVASFVTNRPARLVLSDVTVNAVDGQGLALVGPDGDPEFALTQANTRPEGAEPDVAALLADPEAQAYLKGVASRTLSGEQLSEEAEVKAREQLRRVASRHGLKDTALIVADPRRDVEASAGVIEKVQRGDLAGLSGVELVLFARAAGEVLNLASGVDRSLRGVFKGPNIRAPVGTRVTLQTAKPAKVRAQLPRAEKAPKTDR